MGVLRSETGSFRIRVAGWLLVAGALIRPALPAVSQADEVAPPFTPRLLIACSSYKERQQHPQIYFYEHDGVNQGRRIAGLPTVNKRSDHHPSLSYDGKLCALAIEQEGQNCVIQVWDRGANQFVDAPKLNDTPNGASGTTISATGQLLCFEAWNRPMFPGRWDLALYDFAKKQFVELPQVNTSRYDERNPSLSGDGRWLAYTTNATDSGVSDIVLLELSTGQTAPLPELNTPEMETEPQLSEDGRWIAFVSDRASGEGGRDIYLYDRQAAQLLPLPGLNSSGQEQSPAISGDGRYLLFVSERLEGAGERDLFLYDRQVERLLPLPELNSPRDEMDPALVVLPR